MVSDRPLYLVGATIVLAAALGMVRYRTPLNPLTILALLGGGFLILLPGVVAFSTSTVDPSALHYTAHVSVLYLVAATIPFFFRGRLPARAFGFGMQVLGLRSQTVGTRFSRGRLWLLLGSAGATFALLAVAGGGGTLWLTDPRSAYIGYRSGAGQFWLLTQWFMVFAWLYYLWSRRPRAVALVVTFLAFSTLAFFTGSKNNLLTHGVIAVVYYHFYVRRLGFLTLSLLGLVGAASVLGLLFLQQSYADLLLAFTYFDYFRTTAEFVSRFDEFGLHWGRAWLSSFWFYVPRALYPDKPYEYGMILIHRVLFPGAAELGHTPGILPWTMAYLDFGVVGVFFSGLAHGLWRRMAYEHYLENRSSFFAFVFMLHVSIWGILAFASVSVLVVWSLIQSVLLRLVWVRRGERPVAAAA